MVEVCEGAPVAVSGWVLADRHDLRPCAASSLHQGTMSVSDVMGGTGTHSTTLKKKNNVRQFPTVSFYGNVMRFQPRGRHVNRTCPRAVSFAPGHLPMSTPSPLHRSWVLRKSVFQPPAPTPCYMLRKPGRSFRSRSNRVAAPRVWVASSSALGQQLSVHRKSAALHAGGPRHHTRVPNMPDVFEFCSNECIGLSRTGVRHEHGELAWNDAGGRKGGVTPTSLTRQCHAQSHADHQTRPPNSTKRDQKIPIVGVRVGVCVCACVKWGSDSVSHRGVEVLPFLSGGGGRCGSCRM